MDPNAVFDIFAVLIALLFIVVVAVGIITGVRANRKRQQTLRKLAQSLELTQVDPNEKLVRKISQLYRFNSGERYAMSNVSHKSLPDGELFIFDLEETSSSDNTTLETP